MEKHRLALIGCGGMSKNYLDYPKILSRADIVAAVDIDLERAQKTADHFPGAVAVSDHRKILDDIDAAILVLPHHLHHEIGMDCLRAGKHVLIEKPLANTEKDCVELIKTAEESNLILMIAYCMRFNPLVREIKRLLDDKTYGEVFQISIWTEQKTQYPSEHWASKAETLGGGQLFSHGCHYIDILLWMLGRPKRGVHMGTNYGTPWMEREGTSNVVIEFEGGKLGYHFGTWGARGSRLKYSFHVHCTGGMIEADITGGKLILHKDKKEKLLLDVDTVKAVEKEVLHFLDCIESGKQPLTDGRSSLQGLRVIWKLYGAENDNTLADLRGLGFDQF